MTITVFPVIVFSARQLMDSLEMWGFIVMSISSLVIVFPYKIHVKLQEGVHSAVHVKLVVIPISRESGPEMITFFGPSAREERRHKYGTSQRFFFFTYSNKYREIIFLTRHHHCRLSCFVFFCHRVKSHTIEGGLVWRCSRCEEYGGICRQECAMVKPANGAGGEAVSQTLQLCYRCRQGEHLLTHRAFFRFHNKHLIRTIWKM